MQSRGHTLNVKAAEHELMRNRFLYEFGARGNFSHRMSGTRTYCCQVQMNPYTNPNQVKVNVLQLLRVTYLLLICKCRHLFCRHVAKIIWNNFSGS